MAIAHVRKGDTVMVVAGKERGKKGKVLRVIPEKGRVVVERINLIKKHQKPTQKVRQGGIIEREGSIHLSNVMLIDPASDKPTRVGMRTLSDGKKVRVARRSGEMLDKA
jgi:large subunit ribosomal protein L24